MLKKFRKFMNNGFNRTFINEERQFYDIRERLNNIAVAILQLNQRLNIDVHLIKVI